MVSFAILAFDGNAYANASRFSQFSARQPPAKSTPGSFGHPLGLRYTEVGENREDRCRLSIECLPPGLLLDSRGAAESARTGVHCSGPRPEAAESVPGESYSSRIHLHDVPPLPGGLEGDDEVPTGVWAARIPGAGYRRKR